MTAPTLTEFLLARTGEDEAVAYHGDGGILDEGAVDVWFNKSRVLAECEAKRRIVESRGPIGIPTNHYIPPGEGLTYLDGAHTAVESERDRTLKLLAAVYADHPDYDEAWRP